MKVESINLSSNFVYSDNNKEYIVDISAFINKSHQIFIEYYNSPQPILEDQYISKVFSFCTLKLKAGDKTFLDPISVLFLQRHTVLFKENCNY